MRKYILTAFLIISANSVVLAQPGHGAEGKREKIRALKVAYITDQLQLTPEEAQKFWPVYNEFDEKRHGLEMEIAAPMQDKRPDIALMTDEEVNLFLQQRLVREEQILNLKKEYLAKFKEVLPVKKVFRLYEAEMGFKRMLLERLQDSQRHPYDPDKPE